MESTKEEELVLADRGLPFFPPPPLWISLFFYPRLCHSAIVEEVPRIRLTCMVGPRLFLPPLSLYAFSSFWL